MIARVEKEAFLLFETALYIALCILWETGLMYGGDIAVFQALAFSLD